ncbi:GumC family protein [Salinarimonas ramus]|uniref:Chromosome partitioning protein ParA n=1 Tax=Salinarimonas ramus TaxID=690164 RepID=A0A917V570_9HYPH|nr:polysaccharide biosynthesis tyrosine autokinase [Salinarimonas ramus]GGK38237.1 chromosome partitioning protein ParA [Salinarimonas ramus]
MPFLDEGRPGDDPRLRIDLPALAAFLRRRAWIIALAMVACIGIGGLYAFTAQPKFAAVAGLIIDDPQTDAGRLGTGTTPSAESMIAIETQMQIIRSQDVALAVVDALDLVEDPLFIPDRPDVVTGFVGRLRATVRNSLDAAFAPEPPTLVVEDGAPTSGTGDAAGAAGTALTPRERAAVSIRQDLQVYRLGSSRAVDVRYEGNHPQMAAAIANAVSEAYVRNRLEARFDAAENAADWLRDRIAELQGRFSDTARQVQRFRAENEIVDTGEGRGLINEQALGEVNQRLVAASSQAAEAQARVARIERALESDEIALDAVDSSESPIIAELRARWIELADEEAERAARLSEDSPALAAVRRDLARTEDAIRDELRRLASRLRTEADVARAREENLQDEMARLIARSNETEEAGVRVQQLESEADVLQAAFESYLRRYTDVIQQQSAPFLTARMISPALVPTAPTSPRKAIILVLSAILGGGLGLALAILVESFDRAVRLPRHLEDAGVESLGVVPLVSRDKAFSRRSADGLGYAIAAPGTPFSNGLRRVKAQISRSLPPGGKGAVIGVASLSPGEGASTVAGNLGRLFALGGQTTLLVDANLHTRTLSHAEGDTPVRRLSALGSEDLIERLRDPTENDPSGTPSGADLLGSQRMRAFLEEARERNEVTILDLPALETVPDANAVAPLVDSFVVVTQWGSTSRPALQEMAESLRRHGATIAGGVLNKARLRAMRAHGHRPTDEGYSRRRSRAAA